MSTTSHGPFNIVEVDGLEVLSLVDNSTDFLSAIDRKATQCFRQWTKKRHRSTMDKNTFPTVLCRTWLFNAYSRSMRRKTVSVGNPH